jgi:hypothetical protein
VHGRTTCLIFEDGKRHRLYILESPKPANLKTPAGMFNSVKIGESDGFQIHGTWEANVKMPEKMVWSSEASEMVVFDLDGWSMLVQNTPAKALPVSELTKVAESLKAY